MSQAWRIREEHTVHQIEGLELPPLISRILWARGLREKSKIENWLSPKLSDLRDPKALKGLDVAVERLVLALQKNQKICIYADFDLDGTSGLALLKTGLERLGFKNLMAYQPKRLSEGYGLHVSAIDFLASQGVEVIVTVDVGITAVKAAQRAREKQIDLIITDHHLPQEERPQSFVTVNPNQGDGFAELSHLCGAGVAFYLLWAVKRALANTEFDLKEVLDCFVIGTLTDMVPLIDENRVLVKHGLVQLAQTKRPGLRLLLQELGLGQKNLTSQDVAIRFAPKLNALSRMELDVLPIDLFLIENEAKAAEMVKKVMKNNDLRVSLQSSAEEEAIAMVTAQMDQEFFLVTSKSFHRGVVGLIATRLCQNYGKPAFVGSITDDGQVVGSARRPAQDYRSLVEALTSAEAHLVRFGGHAAAAGFEFSQDQEEAIKKSLEDYFSSHSSDEKFEALFDSEAQISDLNQSFMKWLEYLGPFGNSFEAPILCFRSLKIQSVRELRGGHLKYSLIESTTLQTIEALHFSPVQDSELTAQSYVDVLAEPQINHFMGQKKVQLLIKDLKEILPPVLS